MYKAEWAQKPATYTQSLTLKKQPPPLLYIYCSMGTQDSAKNRTVSALRKLTLCWSDSRANRTTIRGTSASEKTARGQGAGGSLRVAGEPLSERDLGAEPWGGYPGKCARQREQRARGGAPLVSSKRTRRPRGWCAASGGERRLRVAGAFQGLGG